MLSMERWWVLGAALILQWNLSLVSVQCAVCSLAVREQRIHSRAPLPMSNCLQKGAYCFVNRRDEYTETAAWPLSVLSRPHVHMWVILLVMDGVCTRVPHPGLWSHCSSGEPTPVSTEV